MRAETIPSIDDCIPPGPRNGIRHDESFKKDAVRRAMATDASLASVARAVGVEASVLHKWKKKFAADIAPADDIHRELKRLKADVRMLSEQVQLLRGVVHKVCKERCEESVF